MHPIIRSALDAAPATPPYHQLTVAELRASAKRAAPPRPDLGIQGLHDLRIPSPRGEIPVRVYVPLGAGPHPVLMYFHGGGFVLLDLDSHDYLCLRLCNWAACVVVSVDYRLAPEHRFPAAPDDCLAATRWAAQHASEFEADGARLAVAGTSAGGNLAAVTALRARHEGGPPLRAQLLFYPVTDHPSKPPPSYQRYASGFGLDAEHMAWFWQQYLPDAALASHPHASPLRAGSLVGLPPAWLAVGECDVLRDESLAYAARLRQAGVPTLAWECPGLNHSFLKWAGVLPEVDRRLREACDWLRARFA
ncbi:MAG TPA: alpha/beta hydrolase [Ramlibacter sp.]|nr:alpha/beta hydrolase [Ramlibacter sp.]